MSESIVILIVDDNKNNLFSLHTLITEYFEVQVLEANSGLGALKIITQENVHLIILDVQMPEMDGFETAKVIRSRNKMRHIPIVFLTAAYKTNEFQKKGFALGAADYLTKPIDKAQLINRIQSYLRFIKQDQQYKQQLEQKITERTIKLSETNQLLQQEIYKHKQTEIELRAAKEVAEQANIIKSQFLANMSHELRTPLNAIFGYSEILEEEAKELNEIECVSDAKKVQLAAKHLLGLINEVLDISKIEAGKMELFIEPVNIEELIDETASTIKPIIENQNNRFIINKPEYFANMQADVTKLRQMLLNLLSNAAKFTQQGKICFTIDYQTRTDGEWVIFCVTDDGIGITDEEQEILFQPFVQADSSTTRRYGGTGLGLAITKRFSEMMGGTIRLFSEFGKGSIFTIYLPLIAKPKVVETTNLENKIEITGTDNVVLIIDDNINIRELLKEKLTQLNYAVAIAEDGTEGLIIAKKLYPDVIFLNTNLAGISSEEILAILKKHEKLSQIPVILISIKEDEEQSYAMGAIECIDEDIDLHSLSNILSNYQIDSNNLIMVVDDDKITLARLEMLLKSEGWDVLTAMDGKLALELLEKYTPTIILLDLMMPEMDGLEFLNHIEKREKWHSIPIVALTAKKLTKQEYSHLNQYVESIFYKAHYKVEELVSQIQRLIIKKLN
ncbi:MAG: response regulator [Thiomargarita sp.]|nr:response regulator [Thiomargarita sp.]